MAKTLFVYGSFVPGQVHFRKIETYVTGSQSAVALGSVFRLEVGYPVFLADGQHEVKGALLTLAESPVVLNVLDELNAYNPQYPEKSLFHRKEISVISEQGPAEALVYSINPSKMPKTATLIEGGDWQRDLDERAPLTRQLSETQKRYVQRLGASTGREIVPINLELYRELMKAGLIVDKGRRLALTSLGKEVYRYLDE